MPDLPFPPVPPARDAIGGYFQLELTPSVQAPDMRGALRLQSARAAFLALLQTGRPRAVWAPWYLCDAMLEPLQQAGCPVHRYPLDDSFRPPADLAPGDGEWLLYVNHFGLYGAVEDELRRRHGPERLVFDHAQALFAPRGPALATLASPRKFVGVPDGGLLWTTLPVPRPTETDPGSPARAAALLLRAAHGAEAGRQAHRDAEVSLSQQPPRAMSPLTQRLLAASHAPAIATARRRNFALLHAALAPFNRLTLPPLGAQVPLAYPFLPAVPLPHRVLHAARVYVPTYWPELLEESRPVPARERRWAAELLALPVDQRIDTALLDQHVVQPVLAHQRAGRAAADGAAVATGSAAETTHG